MAGKHRANDTQSAEVRGAKAADRAKLEAQHASDTREGLGHVGDPAREAKGTTRGWLSSR